MLRRNVEQYLNTDNELGTAFISLSKQYNWWRWYASKIETRAFYLKLLLAINPQDPVADKVAKHLLNQRQHVTLSMQGKGSLYYSAHVSHFDTQDPIKKSGSQLKITRHYYHTKTEKDGSSTKQKLHKNDILRSGELVEVVLQITSKNDYEYILIEDKKPAEFESPRHKMATRITT